MYFPVQVFLFSPWCLFHGTMYMCCGAAEFAASPCMYRKHRCRLRKDLQLPLTLKGSKEDLQFIRILPHPSHHFMCLFSASVPFPYLRILDVLLYVGAYKRLLILTDVLGPNFEQQSIKCPGQFCSLCAVGWSMPVHTAVYQLQAWAVC